MPKRKSSSTTVSAKRKTPSSTEPLNRQDIVRAIDRASKSHESMASSMQKLWDAYSSNHQNVQDLFDDMAQNGDQMIEDRTRQIAALDEEYKVKERQGRIDIDQNLQQYRLEECRKILDSEGLTMVNKEEYAELQSELTKVKASNEEAIEAAVSKAVAREKQIAKAIEGRIRMEAKVSQAKLEADLSSKLEIIKSFEQERDRLRSDLEAQRELTQGVADAAARNAPVIHTNGSNGK